MRVATHDRKGSIWWRRCCRTPQECERFAVAPTERVLPDSTPEPGQENETLVTAARLLHPRLTFSVIRPLWSNLKTSIKNTPSTFH